MPRIYFHPDIDYQGIKDIEKKYTSTDSNYLLNKASDFISETLQTLLKKTDKTLFICGPGHNGLDGLLSAHKLSVHDYNISIFFTRSNIHEEYIKKLNLNKLIVNDLDMNDNYEFIIDAIFGYGLNRILDKKHINLINSINNSGSKVISLDIPSGLNHVTGEPLPVCFKCDLLISLLTLKRGLFTNKGRDTWKDIKNCNLVKEEIISKDYLITANNKYSNTLNIKSDNCCHKHLHASHKKSYGISCIIAGEKPYHGAMLLSASAAIQAGSKYLQVFTNSEYAHTLPMIMPQVIAKPFSLSNFKDTISSFKQILIGPGTMTAKKYVAVALENIDKLNSVIIDAGALFHIDKNKSYSDKLIITPHPGEAAKLLDITVSEVQTDRYKVARKLYDMFKCLVVLKGSGSIIYDGSSFYTCIDGNYKMGTAGMGDILSGILLAETSLSKNNLKACIKSVVYHSYSSDILYQELKNKNITPSMVSNKYSELTYG